MPPKRKTSELASKLESKKRVTRSATRANTTAAQSLPDESPKTEQKTSRTSRVSKPKKLSPINAKPKADEHSVENSSSAPSNVTTLTITHDIVKNPIQCHQYAPTSPSSTPSPTLIFTHGAGGTLSADAVINFCTGISSSIPVLSFQGSMNLKSRTKSFHACINELDPDQKTRGKEKAGEELREKKLLLGGRSMGARAAVLAASQHLAERKGEEREDEMSVQLVLISYPLHGPKDDLRDQILLDLPKTVNVLFIIGDQDAMCPLNLLEETRRKMIANSQLVVVRGADHGMHVKPASLTKHVGLETGRVAARWVERGGLEADVVFIGE